MSTPEDTPSPSVVRIVEKTRKVWARGLSVLENVNQMIWKSCGSEANVATPSKSLEYLKVAF